MIFGENYKNGAVALLFNLMQISALRSFKNDLSSACVILFAYQNLNGHRNIYLFII